MLDINHSVNIKPNCLKAGFWYKLVNCDAEMCSSTSQQTLKLLEKKRVKTELKRKSSQIVCFQALSGLQQRPEVLVHACSTQTLQAVVAVDDPVRRHHHHPDAVRVLAELAADGRAHHHVQAVVAGAGVPMVMAGEDRLHTCEEDRRNMRKTDRCSREVLWV